MQREKSHKCHSRFVNKELSVFWLGMTSEKGRESEEASGRGAFVMK